MKTIRIILIILGYIFLFFQLAGFFQLLVVEGNERKELFDKQLPDQIAFFFGYCFLFYLSIACFVLANKLKKKIKKKADFDMVDGLGVDGNIS
ncbi:hypothetical protein [Flavisolibacter ginsengisoli]|jgi:hypothetical protein|uniref:Uncharacterized protein n=1 Tax=Flavisolibacter ginsengisoli DSM 18119 TaxID=1121884 RepID=A0A1M5BT38_9BACT|nr:hypothetical protein [Flavisolibacter ginsengisoli]SHF45560.1 hypothetical protein SAMN02745131_02663 [Flavisolibacter ginsengisoli DSM 18119]